MKFLIHNKLIIYMFPMLFLISCATTSKDVYLQSGQKGIEISCRTSNVDNCYSKAGNQCKDRGYNIIRRSEKNSNTKLIIACR